MDHDPAITFPGGSAHGFMYRLEKLSGAKFNTVSFKSGTDAVAAVLGGHVHATAEITQFLTEMGPVLKNQ